MTVAQVMTNTSTAWSETGVLHWAKKAAHMPEVLVVIAEIQPVAKFSLKAIQS